MKGARAALLMAVLAASTSSIFIRAAQQNAPSLVIATYRLTLASLALLPWALARRRELRREFDRRSLLAVLAAGGCLALHFASWISSLELTDVTSSVVLVSTAPLFVALLSPRVLGEHISRPTIAGLVLALGGSGLIALGSSPAGSPDRWPAAAGLAGGLLALLGAVSAAAYMIIGRRVRQTVSLVGYLFALYASAAVVLGLATAAWRLPVIGYPAETYAWFVLLALIPQLIAHSTYNWALRYVSATFVSISLLGEPVGASLLALIFLGETPRGVTLAGALFILAGIALSGLRRPSG
jgi:drug/metabolite transporter (DMT)-like permease